MIHEYISSSIRSIAMDNNLILMIEENEYGSFYNKETPSHFLNNIKHARR